MNESHVHVMEVGEGGRIHLPKDVMKALGVAPGNQIRIEVRGDLISISRHQVRDPFAEAAKKKTPGLKELLAQQEARRKEAAQEFDKRIQEKHEVRPEDREDFWR
ncbi:MAG: AbrB/MazE/SpoVT family DNA-binding domain-containing protein [Candidatus Tectomicrobia bacterium]|uniref:AbrB/MazE/SpoVT family DNA-binding domain-containing protein n=1 Tax=Tectimicrobiota bacterium TaxID=2528274 RepID=A0A932ZSP1_UNCTE|nr:AbrB/MazE/SpoVT family DNA-binding domain-containing protein [Candidatus Tectomicrobia bacterium]MBI2176772.1 AbrB/MazE/SpoVT family DNA-binding domain-containing protein [Candidatus Tectomicrobia bacterium]MBI3024493.1 AbrB/MazE/SpoVT family DNA-binding domain-containing protein [Candidatus Tectomicrobia bacterium]MBI4250938.1 AbrB/MazE/SpoVT family DNA-binding domain-containing protein [Candidatus Tectomicrobia bacterium]